MDDLVPYGEGRLAFEVVEDRENLLLNRREVVCVFRSRAGKITRADAVKAVAQLFGVPAEQIIPVSIEHSHGVRDVKVTFYIFKSLEDAKRQLPQYILLRLLPKDERKKLVGRRRKSEAKE